MLLFFSHSILQEKLQYTFWKIANFNKHEFLHFKFEEKILKSSIN